MCVQILARRDLSYIPPYKPNRRDDQQMFLDSKEHSTDIRDSDGASSGRSLSDDGLVMHHINEGRARGADSLALERSRRGVGELDLAKVGERHELAPHLEVLDDPLRVLLAQRLLAHERVRDGLAGRLVRDRRLAGRLRRGHAHCDIVPGLEADAGEVVRGGGEPFVPSWRTEFMSGSAEKSNHGRSPE